MSDDPANFYARLQSSIDADTRRERKALGPSDATAFADWYLTQVGITLDDAKRRGVTDLGILEDAFNDGRMVPDAYSDHLITTLRCELEEARHEAKIAKAYKRVLKVENERLRGAIRKLGRMSHTADQSELWNVIEDAQRILPENGKAHTPDTNGL